MFKKVIGFLKQPIVIIVIIAVLYFATHVSEHLDETAPIVINLPPEPAVPAVPVEPVAPVLPVEAVAPPMVAEPIVQDTVIPSGSAPVPTSPVHRHKGKKAMTCYAE